MPELPEVETIVNQLAPVLTGRVIKKVHVFWNRSIVGKPEEYSDSIVEQTITRVFRRGKYVCFGLENGKLLTIHMGMSGKLIFNKDKEYHKHIRLQFEFDHDCLLDFIDMRKFGKSRIWYGADHFLPDLGAEPMVSETNFRILMNLTSIRPIKSVLLDQKIIAGIGNIYADESLFRAGIHPLTPACKINPNKIRLLSRIIPRVLKGAIKNMGTTISQYRPPNQPEGSHQKFLMVYGFKGQACKICSTTINRIRINSRSSHFCPKCQTFSA